MRKVEPPASIPSSDQMATAFRREPRQCRGGQRRPMLFDSDRGLGTSTRFRAKTRASDPAIPAVFDRVRCNRVITLVGNLDGLKKFTNGGFGFHRRQLSDRTSDSIVALECQSSLRRSISPICWQAGQMKLGHGWRAAIAAPIRRWTTTRAPWRVGRPRW